MANAKFTYFKASGKFYSSDIGNVPDTNEVWSREQLLSVNGFRMPGLSTTGSSFIVVVHPEGEFGWPQIKFIDEED